MGKYLKLFETHQQYESYTASTTFIKPNVSFCIDTPNEVHYNPYVDPCQQYDYVEIAGIKWATKNVGACDVTDVGLYFQWGDTQGYTASEVGTGSGQKAFKWEDYKYGNGTSDPGATGMTKYNGTDGKTVLEASDDAVIANLGGSWRMPTTEEFKALSATTTTVWTADYEGSGVSGLVLTSKVDGVTLFFPASGECFNGSLKYAGYLGYYWSSSLVIGGKQSGYYFGFDSRNMAWQNSSLRYLGFNVRAVLDE